MYETAQWRNGTDDDANDDSDDGVGTSNRNGNSDKNVY